MFCSTKKRFLNGRKFSLTSCFFYDTSWLVWCCVLLSDSVVVCLVLSNTEWIGGKIMLRVHWQRHNNYGTTIRVCRIIIVRKKSFVIGRFIFYNAIKLYVWNEKNIGVLLVFTTKWVRRCSRDPRTSASLILKWIIFL